MGGAALPWIKLEVPGPLAWQQDLHVRLLIELSPQVPNLRKSALLAEAHAEVLIKSINGIAAEHGSACRRGRRWHFRLPSTTAIQWIMVSYHNYIDYDHDTIIHWMDYGNYHSNSLYNSPPVHPI
jgi:hypothetical protein